MLEDKWLVWKLKHGSSDALRLLYEKYKGNLLALAVTLSSDKASAEDIVHDVFVAFAKSASKLQLKDNLKSYLTTSVANRVRNSGRCKTKLTLDVDSIEMSDLGSNQPDSLIMAREESQRVGCALAQLPYEQREVIILHFQSGLKFKEIANVQSASINTIQSRYRYGLSRLRAILDGEVKK